MGAAEQVEAKVSSAGKARQEAERRVKAIVAKSKRLGLGDADLARLFAFAERRAERTSLGRKGCLVAAAASLLCVAFCVLGGPLSSDDRCRIEMPGFVTKAARPPEECSMCEGIREVERVANLTPDEFEERYAYSGVPVVVTDAMLHWAATKAFDFRFFKKLFLESELGTAARDCQFFPYKTEFRNLYDALEMDEDRANLTAGTKPWYIGWSNCHDSTARVLRLYYDRPYFLPRTSENTAVDWIFMGGPGDGAQMHVDNVVHPSWQAQLRGMKRWHLAPPPECYYSCEFLEVTVNPGEIIAVDTNRWYHKTEILPGDISITIGAEYD